MININALEMFHYVISTSAFGQVQTTQKISTKNEKKSKDETSFVLMAPENMPIGGIILFYFLFC